MDETMDDASLMLEVMAEVEDPKTAVMARCLAGKTQRGRGRSRATLALIENTQEILTECHPMTVRQVFYALVTRGAIKNTKRDYERLVRVLVAARKEGEVPWDWIEDRTRLPSVPAGWTGLADFGQTMADVYRRDVWEYVDDRGQMPYFEVWLEKAALARVFEEVTDEYGVVLNIGRGYDGWSSIKDAAYRLRERSSDSRVEILYFGDLDPSGVDIERSLQERLQYFGCIAFVKRHGVTEEDIETYNLPPDPTKKTDRRASAFIEEYGDISVELDALPMDIIQNRLRDLIEARLDMGSVERMHKAEERERARLVQALAVLDGERDDV